ncbi:MAG: hypothetical protein JSV69_15465 [Chloroflexota bacterium]|nr:MAG: hypothetical protein JSV69_15465 [Chloroflexota bacterium]
MPRTIIWIVILGLASLACQLSSLTSELFDTPSGSVLFQDDFSDTSSGWQNQSREEFGTVDYFDGYYRIAVQGDQNMIWAGPGLNFTDVRIEADMIKVIGSEDDLFGLVCRAADHENYYFFVISSDGYYGIGKTINGVQSMINAEGMHPSEIVSQGKTINHLRADCIADRLELSINGQLVAQVRDPDLSQGDVGLLAGNLASQENVVLFDNFSTIKP